MRVLLVAVGCALLSACGTSGPSKDELEGQVDELTTQLATAQETIEERDAQLEDARTKVGTLADASTALQGQVARFDQEDWRDVVPEARSAAGDVEDATGDAESAVAEQ